MLPPSRSLRLKCWVWLRGTCQAGLLFSKLINCGSCTEVLYCYCCACSGEEDREDLLALYEMRKSAPRVRCLCLRGGGQVDVVPLCQ